MNPDIFNLDTYDYDLPQELIAQYPLPGRTSSKLMHLDRTTGAISHLHFGDILGILEQNDVLVLNDSKVIPARLFGHKANGTIVEVFLVNQVSDRTWKCLVSPGKRLKEPQLLSFSAELTGWVSLPDSFGMRVIEFISSRDYWVEIEKVGHIPLPPYIKREDEPSDRERYQTVYAIQPGSVAAPTAGLHFTKDLLDKIEDKGVRICRITLHVGLGTFLPVKSDDITKHVMHSEFYTIPPDTAALINEAKHTGGRVVAVGSTSLRALESSWQGDQVVCGSQYTDIFIYPGKNICSTDILITNFHLPKSSLIMMIAAFADLNTIKRAYTQAVERRYRFFSYGDAMVIT